MPDDWKEEKSSLQALKAEESKKEGTLAAEEDFTAEIESDDLETVCILLS